MAARAHAPAAATGLDPIYYLVDAARAVSPAFNEGAVLLSPLVAVVVAAATLRSRRRPLSAAVERLRGDGDERATVHGSARRARILRPLSALVAASAGTAPAARVQQDEENDNGDRGKERPPRASVCGSRT